MRRTSTRQCRACFDTRGKVAPPGLEDVPRGFVEHEINLDQARQFCLGVVRRDATTVMPQQVLMILERQIRRPPPAAESALGS